MIFQWNIRTVSSRKVGQ